MNLKNDLFIWYVNIMDFSSECFKRMKLKRTDNIIYLFILVTLYILNITSPLSGDDYYYSLIMRPDFNLDIEFLPINNISDIWKSQIWSYKYYNGRFILHFIVQLFCSIIGLKSFQVINSIIFLLLIVGINKILRLKCKLKNSLDIFISLILVFLSIPVIGLTYLGNISFSINYLWTSCAVVWYLYVLFVRPSNVPNILLFLFSFIVGSLQESFSIGLSCVLGLYMLTNLKKLHGNQKYLIIGFIIGSAIGILAPSNFLRFETHRGDSSFSIISLFLQCIRVLLSLRMFWLMSILLFIGYIKNKEKLQLKEYLWAFGICIINILFAIVVAMTGKHQLVSVELFSMIITICIIYDYYNVFLDKYSKYISLGLIAIYILLLVPIVKYRFLINKEYKSIMLQAENVDADIIVDKEFGLYSQTSNWFISKYCMLNDYSKWNKRGLSLYLTKGSNGHKIKSIIPEEKDSIISYCIRSNAFNEEVYKRPNSPYYILRIPFSDIDRFQCHIDSRPGFIGGLFIKYILRNDNYVDRQVLNVSHCNTFKTEEYIYAIVPDYPQIQDVKILYAE